VTETDGRTDLQRHMRRSGHGRLSVRHVGLVRRQRTLLIFQTPIAAAMATAAVAPNRAE